MVMIQAHRGFSDNYPESTLLAFQSALNVGADGIEADIQSTSDGEFIVIHDSTIDRTVAGGLTGNVNSYTLAELQAMDFSYPAKFGTTFLGRTDCKILTLSELLDHFNGKDIKIVLHINIWYEPHVQSIVDMVTSRGMLEQCHFFGDPIIIGYVKNYDPNAFTYNSGMAGITTYQDLISNAITNNHNAVSINANASEADLTTMITNIHNSGLLVHASYISSDYTYKTNLLHGLGVDMILGNDPLEMLIAIGRVEPTDTKIRNSSDVLVYIDGWYKSVETLVKSDNNWVKMSSIKVRV